MCLRITKENTFYGPRGQLVKHGRNIVYKAETPKDTWRCIKDRFASMQIGKGRYATKYTGWYSIGKKASCKNCIPKNHLSTCI